MAEELDERWLEVTNFHELLILNAEFVRGELPRTPYNYGSIEASSPKFINKLVKLHEYGLLTTDGQEPTCKYGAYDKGGEDSKIPFDTVGPFYYDEERKGYLHFSVDMKDNGPFVNSLFKLIDKSNLIYLTYNPYRQRYITSLLDGESYNVTRFRLGETKEELEEAEWKYRTNIHIIPDEDLLRPMGLWGYPEIDPILENCLHFDVALPNYCEGDLEGELLDMCKEIGGKKYDLNW
jgi:hypothetical protein